MDAQNGKPEVLTLSVPVAGRLLGLSRGAAYAAAQRGDLPGVLRVGRRVLVSRIILQRFLEGDWPPGGNGADQA